jgi:ParB-like chromosome segregation protein Spo0J
MLENFRAAIAPLAELPLAERVTMLNAMRRELHALSPFRDQPIDLVEWVPLAKVHQNDYNPNTVAPPEMALLYESIAADGYTQPIVTSPDGDTKEIVDGFHRHRVGRECLDVTERLHGYLPVTTLRSERTDRADRMAATIRHNRARGKHGVTAMGEIVQELVRRNWSDEKIARELGMDPDEVLRLKQMTGLAELFAGQGFSEAWELRDDQ